MEHAEALLVGVDEDGDVRFASPHACVALGVEGDPGTSSFSLTGVPFVDTFVDAAARKRATRAFHAALAGERVVGLSLPLPGHARVVRWTLSPVSAEAERDVPRVMAVGVDVTDQLAAETAAREAESMAAMGRLTAGSRTKCETH